MPADVLQLQPPAGQPPPTPDALLEQLRDALAQLWACLHRLVMVSAGLQAPCAVVPGGAALRRAAAAAADSAGPLRAQGSRSNSKEARQWLFNNLACLPISDPEAKTRSFARYLPRGSACRGAEHLGLGQGLLQLLFEVAPDKARCRSGRGGGQQAGSGLGWSGRLGRQGAQPKTPCHPQPAAPPQAGPLLADSPSLLRAFFAGDPRRARLWFGGFSMEVGCGAAARAVHLCVPPAGGAAGTADPGSRAAAAAGHA